MTRADNAPACATCPHWQRAAPQMTAYGMAPCALDAAPWTAVSPSFSCGRHPAVIVPAPESKKEPSRVMQNLF